MENLENLSNTDKVTISALLGDAYQSAKGLTCRIQNIQESFADPTKLLDSMKMLNQVCIQLYCMRNDLDKEIDWEAMVGTDWQPEQ